MARSPFTLSMWMKTSSRRGSTSRQVRPAKSRPRGSRFRARCGRCRRRGARGRTRRRPRRPACGAGVRAASSTSAPVASKVISPDCARHLVGAALHHDAPAGEIDDAVAALGLVHVVGRDQHGEAFARHVVDHVPELAPRLGVDAGGRLVEQQELRLMQDAGGEREALLPAAGQLAGELVAAIGEPHAVHDAPHRLARAAASRRRSPPDRDSRTR